MFIYIFTDVIVISLFLIFSGDRLFLFNDPIIYEKKRIVGKENIKETMKGKFVIYRSHGYLSLVFLWLFFVSAFRGNFTSDYDHYVNWFNIIKELSLRDILHHIISNNFITSEGGFKILLKGLSLITDNGVIVAIATTWIILWGYLKVIKDYSVAKWFSILLFVSIGQYYTSFNLTSQILAVSITFLAAKYLYSREFKKYVLMIIFATLFHLSALIMLPFYFILNFRLNKKNVIIIIFAFIFGMLFLDNIVTVGIKYFYKYYEINRGYGMTGMNYKIAIAPIAVFIFVLFFRRSINKEELQDRKIKIWLNALIYFVVFTLFGLKIKMVQRFAEYFAPYILLLLPFIISKFKPSTKFIVATGVMMIVPIYTYVIYKNSGWDPFCFIWK